MNSKDSQQGDVLPEMYEVTRGENYHGLKVASKNFLLLSKDPLYLFPLLDTQNIDSEPNAFISSHSLTYTHNINISSTLSVLHAQSPFGKFKDFPDICCFNLSNEAPVNSFATSEDMFFIETNRGESITGFLDLPKMPQRSVTPSQELSISNLDSFDKNAIINIHRNFMVKAQDNIYRSITPDHSSISETPAERHLTSKVLDDNLNLSKISRASMYEEINENWGSVISPRPSEVDERFLTTLVFDRLKSTDITEDGLSMVEEGTAQVVRDFIPFESTASKNLLLTSKSRNEIDHPNPYSPILRKMVICESEELSEPKLEIIASACFVGFKAALSLEYSNVEAVNKAKIDCHKDLFTTKSLFSERIVLTLSKNDVIYLSCGFEHCALVTSAGKVMTWGYGASGCLGHGNTLSLAIPTLISDLQNENIHYLECGGYHTVAITSKNEVFVWGRGDVHQLGLHYRQLCKDEMGYVALKPTKLIFFTARGISPKFCACGESHTLVLDSEGRVYAFGWGQEGQLGLPMSLLTQQKRTSEITQIGSLTTKVVKISAGCLFSAALNEKGEVWVWGNGSQGQLGLTPSTKKSEEPVKVVGISEEFIVDIVCGENNMICMSASCKVFGWGQGKAGVYSSQEKSVPVGTDMICSYPKLLAETDISHHFVVQKSGRKVLSSQEYRGIISVYKKQRNCN